MSESQEGKGQRGGPVMTRRGFLGAAVTIAAGAIVEGTIRGTSRSVQTLAIPHEGALIEPDPITQIKDFVFQGYTPEERQLAEAEVKKYQDEYSDKAYLSKRSLVKGYKYYIEDAYQTIAKLPQTNQLPSYIDPVWKNLILGIIFVESKGDPDEPGENGEIGVCQIKPWIADEIRGILKWGKVNLKEVDKNISLGLTLLLHEFAMTEEPGMAIWAYTDGDPTLQKKIKQERSIKDNSKTLKTLISEYNLNPTRMSDAKKEYVYQVLGAAFAVLNSPEPK